MATGLPQEPRPVLRWRECLFSGAVISVEDISFRREWATAWARGLWWPDAEGLAGVALELGSAAGGALL